MTTRPLTDRERACILAALRYWQREGCMSAGAEQDIATDGGVLEPLSVEEIDDLTEHLNLNIDAEETPTP
ncbi:MAG: hypothetical protein M0Z85_09420 [Gammaproteobacteria bacterium]|nr:hypothetical protein [Gammaproteobacteria bacterium]